MLSSRPEFLRKFLFRRVWGSIAGAGIFIWAGVGFPTCGLGAQAQSTLPAPTASEKAATSSATQTAAPTVGQASNQPQAASISGDVIGPDGSPVVEATLTLVREGQTVQQVRTADNGQFSFAGIAAGIYQITINASGFETKSVNVVLNPGELRTLPRVSLALAPLVTSIKVTPSRAEVSHFQLQQEEKQLVLGFIPNYYVTYYPHTAPLSSRQKFQLAWKSVFNVYNFGLTAALAGGQQATGMYSGYGQGAQGYAKRFGAAYADVAVGAFIGGALLPSLLKQDPRYYYKGTGSVGARLLYAITRSVVCKGDNGHWQACYSNILGDFASAGISNLYYPAQNREGFGLTIENTVIGIGFDAVSNVFQEFVVPKFTPVLAHRQQSMP